LIVKQLIDNDIPFEKDGGFFLETDGTFAEAKLGFHNQRIFIRPQSDNDK
jgi:DEAD/DEAH box helicase domain-containing protein